MSNLQTAGVLFGANALDTSAIDQNGLGTLAYDSHGRKLRWVKAGGSNVSRGKLQLAPAPKTNHHDIAVNTAEQGDTTIDVTPGATAVTANEYAGGYVVVNDDTGEGIAYEIDSHPASDASTEFTVTLSEAIKVAFGADTTVTLVHNPFNGVVEGTSQTQTPVGVAANSISSGEYGWVIVEGVAPALADATIDLGATVVAGSSTAGAVQAISDTAATAVDTVPVGQAIVAGVDGEYRPIHVTIG